MRSGRLKSGEWLEEDDFEPLLPQNDSFDDSGAVPATKAISTDNSSWIREPCKSARNKSEFEGETKITQYTEITLLDTKALENERITKL